MEKSKKIKLNFATGVLSEILTLVFGIIIPRLTLTNYGSEVNGLVSSISQIYAYVALAEAGVGTATLQALYRTVGREDKYGTNSVLAATNVFYRRTGFIYLLAIAAFSIIYPLFVESDVPTVTTILIIVFLGLGSVISYFFQAKYSIFLQAQGENYVLTTLNMLTTVFKNAAKIVLMLLGMNVVFVQMIGTAVSLIQMAFILIYVRKRYSWLDISVKPDFQSISQSKNVIVHQISSLIFNNTDILILTAFCGLKIVSVYSLYGLVYSITTTFSGLIISSLIFSLGQKFNVDKGGFIRDYDAVETLFFAIIFCLLTITDFFILPFLQVYTAGIEDINYIDVYLPIIFAANVILNNARIVAGHTIGFAGHFKQTQWRSVLESAINLSTSLLLVGKLGIYGVLLGTFIALLYRTNDILIYTNRHILNRSAWKTYRRLAVFLALFVGLKLLSKMLTLEMNNYFTMVMYAIPYAIICAGLYFAASYLIDKKSTQYLLSIVKTKFLHKT